MCGLGVRGDGCSVTEKDTDPDPPRLVLDSGACKVYDSSPSSSTSCHDVTGADVREGLGVCEIGRYLHGNCSGRRLRVISGARRPAATKLKLFLSHWPETVIRALDASTRVKARHRVSLSSATF